MKKIWIAAALVLALLVTGCARTVLTGVGAGNLMAGIKANEVNPSGAIADTTDFALSLLKNTYTGENTVVSPVSAYLALAMTANGASGETLREFERVLGASLGELNDTGKLLLDAFKEASGVTLKAADGIWYNTAGSFTPSADFLQTNADYFDAAAYAADFARQATLDEINGYISENTNGLIEKMLDKIDADIMILVNTLYFKGDWASQFDPSDTTDARFTLADGQSVYTPTMKQEYDDALYLESDTARGILLPYVDGRYAYAAILPEDDVSAYVQGLTADAFKALLDSASPEKVKLYMPRYEADGSYDLNGILKTMGLEQAFDPDRADFSAMGSAELGNLYIDKVRQDIVFKLGETGTEAAAATSVEMALTALPIGERQIELHLDRPFVYALMDMETMTPLFMGVLENPAE